jgi:hypothetical protein
MSGRKSRSHSKEHRDPRKYPGRQQERRSSRESPPPPVSRAQSTARGSPERSKPRRSSRDTPSPPISRAQSTARVQPEKSKHERKASPRRDYPYTPQKTSATRGRSPLRSRHPSSSSSHQGESSGYKRPYTAYRSASKREDSPAVKRRHESPIASGSQSRKTPPRQPKYSPPKATKLVKPYFPPFPELEKMDAKTKEEFLYVLSNQWDEILRDTRAMGVSLPKFPEFREGTDDGQKRKIYKYFRDCCESAWNAAVGGKKSPKKGSRRGRGGSQSLSRSESSKTRRTPRKEESGKDEDTASEAAESEDSERPPKELEPGVLDIDMRDEAAKRKVLEEDPHEIAARAAEAKFTIKVHPFLGSVAVPEETPESIWDLVPFAHSEGVLRNRHMDYSDPAHNSGPQGPNYKPHIVHKAPPVHLLFYTKAQFEADYEKFQTKDASYQVKQAQHITPGDEFLIEVCKEIQQSGLMTLQAATKGYALAIGTYTGKVIVLTHKDRYLDIPKRIKEFLTDPTIIKVGRHIQETVINVGNATREGQNVTGCYDLRWGINDLHVPLNAGTFEEPAFKFANTAENFDGFRYPSVEVEEQMRGNPYTESWEKLHTEWKLSLLQSTRLTAYLLFRQVISLTDTWLVSAGRNLMPYMRLLFAVLSMAKPVASGAVQKRRMNPTAQWIKEDPYYVTQEERSWFFDIVDPAKIITEYQKAAKGLYNQRFKQWNKRRQYDYKCTQCDTQLSTTKEVEEHTNCPLETGIYGDGVYCEYPICESPSHTILTCNLVTAWCQLCERRGHLPYHHLTKDLIYLEEMYLTFEPFNLKTGFKLLTAGRHLRDKITPNHWRFSLYAHLPEELPKMLLMQPQLDVGVPELALTDLEGQLDKLQNHYYYVAQKVDNQKRKGGTEYSVAEIEDFQKDLENTKDKMEILYRKQAEENAKLREEVRQNTANDEFYRDHEQYPLMKVEVRRGRRMLFLLKGFATTELSRKIHQSKKLHNEDVSPIEEYVPSRKTFDGYFAIYRFEKYLEDYIPLATEVGITRDSERSFYKKLEDEFSEEEGDKEMEEMIPVTNVEEQLITYTAATPAPSPGSSAAQAPQKEAELFEVSASTSGATSSVMELGEEEFGSGTEADAGAQAMEDEALLDTDSDEGEGKGKDTSPGPKASTPRGEKKKKKKSKK